MEGNGSRWLDIFFPRRCALCDRVLPLQTEFICKDCASDVRYTGKNCCMKCGRPVLEGQEYCGECDVGATSYHSGRSVFLYDTVLRESISRFKYQGRQEYAAFYADAMYRQCKEWLQQIQPDVLLPVPIHRERYRKRGYNQAQLLADALGKLCNVPVWSDYLLRVKSTIPQKELSKKEREENLNGAFLVRTSSQELYKTPNCVILIDDIYTTGSTIENCAYVLRKAGVEKICFLCISTVQNL